MKRIIITILGLISIALAQTTPVAKVATIVQLKAYNGTAAFVYVTDSLKTYTTCSPCTADEVYVFAGSSGKKWTANKDAAMNKVALDSKPTLMTITQMRALASVASGTVVQSTDAGQEGLWKWNSSSTATDNTGTVIKPTSITTGRFERVINGAVRISWFGTDGTGATNSTTAIQAAINTGYPIQSEHAHKKYLISPLTQSTGWQVLDFSGDTLKLAASSSSYMLTLSGVGAQVYGGVWDGNKAGTQSTSNSYYDHAAVNVTASYCVVSKAESINSAGIGIKVGTVDYTVIEKCVLRDWNVHGIFEEGVGRDCYHNKIQHNYVFVNANSGVGIYFKGDPVATSYYQRYGEVNYNHVFGPKTGAAVTDICITFRAIDGECIGNQTVGADMGISADITRNSTIALNKIDSTGGPTGYGLEVNGGNNIISLNEIRYTKKGIIGSGSAYPMDNNKYLANILNEQTDFGIFVQPTSTNTARNLSIDGNTFTRTGTGTWNAIRLANDCKFSKGQSNIIVGPGVAVSNSRAIFLDKVGSNIDFISNTISGVERPMSVYNTDASAYTNINFNHNNCAGEAGISEANFLVTEGTATLGNYCQQIDNPTSTGRGTDYVDKGGNIIFRYGTGSPESAVTAATGSVFIRTNGAGTTTMYVKGSGTGNTGWTALSDGDAHLAIAETFTGKKTYNPSITGSGGFASAMDITGTVTGGANSDALVGLKITPTFATGGFSSTVNYGVYVTAAFNKFTIGNGASNVLQIENTSTGTTANLFLNLINGGANTAGLRYESSTNGSNPNRLQITNGANAPISIAISGTEVFKIPTAGGLLTLSGYTGTGKLPVYFDANGQLTRTGAVVTLLAAKSAAYTLAATDKTVTGDATSAAFSFTLPSAVGVTGQEYTLKKIDASANAVTVATTSSQTIDGSTTYALSARWKFVTVQSDGANWLIISNN
jgi:hypothetical protein